MSACYALEMIHENDVHRGAADGAENRQRAPGRALGVTTIPNRVAISVTRLLTTRRR